MSATLRDILRRLLNEEAMEDDVLDAIDNKYYVSIRYDDEKEGNAVGDPRGRRIIQPMAYGTTKAGNPVLRAFQINGASRKGAPKWKFFRLDRITSWNPMRNKHFSEPPDESFGRYNKSGDKTMQLFQKNATFDNADESPLERERRRGRDAINAPKMSTRNATGPINATQQWKRNVFTSQPNSARYAQYARNIKDTEDETDRLDDDFWANAERERAAQETDRLGNGPILNGEERDEFEEQ